MTSKERLYLVNSNTKLNLIFKDAWLNFKEIRLWFIYNMSSFLRCLQEASFQECWSVQDCEEDFLIGMSLSYN